MHGTGESLQKTFERLKRLAIRLQKTLGPEYQCDAMQCDFFRRALQDESFWGWVNDYELDITAGKMCGKIMIAIVKHERLHKSKRDTNSMICTVSMANADTAEESFTKGAVMTCTGYGSDSHFYRKCNILNKEELRQKKLKEICETKGKTHKSQHRSYFLQMDEVSSENKTEADEKRPRRYADENDDDA